MSGDSSGREPKPAVTTVKCSIPESIANLIPPALRRDEREVPTVEEEVPAEIPLFLSVKAPSSQDTPAPPPESGVSPRPSEPPGDGRVHERLREIAALSQPDRYAYLDLLGRGGMGVVHRVADRVLGREAAMKLLEGPLGDRPVEVLRFLEEAQITGQLDHPGIVPVHDFGIGADGSRAYFTMKLVRGDTLARLISTHRALGLEGRTLERLLRAFVRVCEAVSFAHARRVVHRDLKPDNILLGSHGEVYVMDWGLARVVEGGRPSERAVTRGPVAGTPAYMAPEQAQGRNEDIDQRSDVFGLGGILYAILVGRGPFQADKPEKSLLMAQRYELERIDDQRENVPPELARIAMKALAEHPDDRYPTVEELARDVEEFLRGGGWFVTRKYEPGTTIIEEGEPGSAAYVLVEGTCEVMKMVDGHRIKLRTLGPGDVFGETAVFTAKPRSATVIAVDHVTVKVVTRESLERELDRSPWMGAFVRAVAERFREADEKLSKR
ncbi:MAG: protein kinase [Myxococcales bacterium]|nr:protein kinase [Myxococcales bacterium]